MKLITYRDRSGEHRWRLKADNGRIIADSSEGYANGRNARRAATRFVVLVAQFAKDVVRQGKQWQTEPRP